MDVVINNPAMYKPCKYKKYSAFAWIPELNTAVVDAIKYPEVAQVLETCFITARDLPYYAEKLNKIKDTYPNSVFYVTGDTPIVLGIESSAGLELTTISVRQFFTRYKTASGTMASLEQLKKGWVKVQYEPNPAEVYSACFVPANQVGVLPDTREVYNRPGAKHGMGDFIVAKMHDNGSISSRFVVNGLVFGTMFNNNGFTQFLAKPDIKDKKVLTSPPCLVKTAPIQPYSFAALRERLAVHDRGVELMMTVPEEYTYVNCTLSVLAWFLTLSYLSFANTFGAMPLTDYSRGAVRRNGNMVSGCRIGYNQPNGFDMCMRFELKTGDTVKRMQMNWHVDIMGIFVRVESQLHGNGSGNVTQSVKKEVNTPYDDKIGDIAHSEGVEFCIDNRDKLTAWFSDYIKNWWDSK